MTQYTNRVSFLTIVAYVNDCNQLANALGRSGNNFTVPLSPDGREPATHYAGSTLETDNFVSFLTGVGATPEGITEAQREAVEANLIFSLSTPQETPPQAFLRLLESEGLKVVQTEEQE